MENNTNQTALPFLSVDNSLVSAWFIYCYVASISFGTAVCVMQSACLLFRKKTRFESLILQLCICDILLLFVAINEILTLYYNTWMLSSEMCMAFRGMEVFANSLTIYTIVCINFHVLSLTNLHSLHTVVNGRNPLTCKTDSDECLVTKHENRSVNNSYQKIKTDVSIIEPLILIWLVSFSLSIPSFTLSTIFKINNTAKCVIVYNCYGELLYYLMLVFRCAVPVLFLVLLLQMLIVKLVNISKKKVNVLTKDNSNIIRLLVFCILLTLTFMVTSFQRYILYFVTTINTSNNFKFSVMYNIDINTYSNIYLSMIHYASVCIRANFYLFMLPNFLKGCSNCMSMLRNNRT